MRPVPYIFPWFTTDLTLGQVHRITNNETGGIRYAVLFPKLWEKSGKPQTMHVTVDGRNEPVQIQHYRVLEWEERELLLL